LLDARDCAVGHDEQQRIAARKLRDERTSHALSATALVHEAWPN
jgi:hypothetical protein